MVLADTMAIFLVIVGLLICFNAVWLFCRALWEPLVTHARDAHNDGMIKSFFVGLPLTALVVVAFGALANDKQGPLGLVGWIMMGVFVLFSSIGVSGIASMIGERLGGNIASPPPWRETVRGGAVLVLSFLFPIVGWFVVMPICFVVGCGATIRAVFREWKCSRQEKAKKRTAASLAAQSALPGATVPLTTSEMVGDANTDSVDLNRDR
jgi:hypothetical protein